MTSYLRAVAALEKAQSDDEKYSLYDRMFTSNFDKDRVKALYNEIKGFARELRPGGKIEISFDSKHWHGKMVHRDQSYQGGIITYTGRVTWIAYDMAHSSLVRKSMYRASEDDVEGLRNKWCSRLPVEIRKRILEDLLGQVETATKRLMGPHYKTRMMQKYADLAFLNQLPGTPETPGTLSVSDGGAGPQKERILMLEDGLEDSALVTRNALIGHHPMPARNDLMRAHGRSGQSKGTRGFDNGAGNTYFFCD
ncbi:hypothetical protein IWX90DRAFT_416489 [Phyllosticta citrichinensis]|uniref:Uncharacterized protein n=1 Tax=Phyllosticta citrichinensis TaxID=1130410 RepID=A0ABR1XMJ0_9PEZI